MINDRHYLAFPVWVGWVMLLIAQLVPADTRAQSTSAALVAEVARHFSDMKIEDGAVVVDNYARLKKYPEFMKLRELMLQNSKMVVTEVMNSNPRSLERAVLLVSARILAPNEYRNYLDLMLDYAEAGLLEKREMKWAIFPSSPTLANSWATTWTDTQTKVAVNRVQKLFVDDPDMQSHCARLLSGELNSESVDAGKRMTTSKQMAGELSSGSNDSRGRNQLIEKPNRSTLSDKPDSSTPWSIIVVLIVAAIGLLWLLLKGRK